MGAAGPGGHTWPLPLLHQPPSQELALSALHSHTARLHTRAHAHSHIRGCAHLQDCPQAHAALARPHTPLTHTRRTRKCPARLHMDASSHRTSAHSVPVATRECVRATQGRRPQPLRRWRPYAAPPLLQPGGPLRPRGGHGQHREARAAAVLGAGRLPREALGDVTRPDRREKPALR